MIGKYVYVGYGISFDGAGSRGFNNVFAWNVLIFDVNKSSEPHTSNCNNKLLVLCEGPTDDINGSVGNSEKKG